MKSAGGKFFALLIPVVLLLVVSWAFLHKPAAGPAPRQPGAPAASAHASLAPILHPKGLAWGLSVPAPLAAHLDHFDSLVGDSPDIVSSYQRFGQPLTDGALRFIVSRGAVPLLQWNPTTVKLDAIASGQYDTYLRHSATVLKAMRSRVIVSFGHEMNGPWWPWSGHHQSASSFIAAWRHIVTVFRAQHASNVTWLWNPNALSGPEVASPAAWWPGAAYVDWTGLDGYFWTPSQSFAALFGAGITQLRRLAPGKPMIIAETGAYPGPGMAARMTKLFYGARASGLAAVVYFDHQGHSDWRIERNPGAVAAFRAAVKRFK